MLGLSYAQTVIDFANTPKSEALGEKITIGFTSIPMSVSLDERLHMRSYLLYGFQISQFIWVIELVNENGDFWAVYLKLAFLFFQ